MPSKTTFVVFLWLMLFLSEACQLIKKEDLIFCKEKNTFYIEEVQNEPLNELIISCQNPNIEDLKIINDNNYLSKNYSKIHTDECSVSFLSVLFENFLNVRKSVQNININEAPEDVSISDLTRQFSSVTFLELKNSNVKEELELFEGPNSTLTDLSIYNSDRESFPFIRGENGIQKVTISRWKKLTNLTNLGRSFSNLQALTLVHNPKLTNLLTLTGCQSLHSLEIHGESRKSPMDFSDEFVQLLPNLKVFILNKVFIRNVPSTSRLFVNTLEKIQWINNKCEKSEASEIIWSSRLFKDLENLTDFEFGFHPSQDCSLIIEESAFGDNVFDKLERLKITHTNLGYEDLIAKFASKCPKLKFLDVRYNRIQSFQSDQDVPDSVTDLYLGGNVFDCTCETVKSIEFWANSSRILNDTRRIKFQGCQDAAAESNLEDAIENCHNEWTNVIVLVTLLILMIFIFAIIVKLFKTDVLKMVYFNSFCNCLIPAHKSEDYEFDLYLSHASEDSDVMEIFLSRLTQGTFQRRFRVAVHPNDFILGQTFFDNSQRVIRVSRKTVALVSKNYLQSSDCQEEIRIAMNGEQKLVLVVLDNEAFRAYLEENMDLQRYLTKNNTHSQLAYDEGSETFWKSLVFALPHKKIEKKSREDVEHNVVELRPLSDM